MKGKRNCVIIKVNSIEMTWKIKQTVDSSLLQMVTLLFLIPSSLVILSVKENEYGCTSKPTIFNYEVLCKPFKMAYI